MMLELPDELTQTISRCALGFSAAIGHDKALLSPRQEVTWICGLLEKGKRI